MSQLQAAGVPCGPVNDLSQVFADPQVLARRLRLDLPHSVAGSAPGVASPLRLSRTPVAYQHSAPLLGEHSETVLRDWLGLDTTQLAQLRAQGVIG